MQTTLTMRTRVLPGKRIEVTAPELIENTDVDVVVVLPEASETAKDTQAQGVWDYIQSLPPGPRSAATWEEIERNFQEERAAWDR